MITRFLSTIPRVFSSEKAMPMTSSILVENARDNFSQKLMGILRSAELKDVLNSVSHGVSISNGIIHKLDLVEPVDVPVTLTVSRQDSNGNTFQENGNFLLTVVSDPDNKMSVLGIKRITSRGNIDDSFTFLPETHQLSFVDRRGKKRLLDILDIDYMDLPDK